MTGLGRERKSWEGFQEEVTCQLVLKGRIGFSSGSKGVKEAAQGWDAPWAEVGKRGRRRHGEGGERSTGWLEWGQTGLELWSSFQGSSWRP